MLIFPEQDLGDHKACPVKLLSTPNPSWDFVVKDKTTFIQFLRLVLKAWRCAKKDENVLRIHVNQDE